MSDAPQAEKRGLLARWQNEVGDTYVVSLVRTLLGVLLLISALREARDLSRSRYFGDVFHMPIVPEGWVPSYGVYWAIVSMQIVAAALVIVNCFARPVLLMSAVTGLYLLCCDRVSYHNNRYALCLFALLISLAPCDSWPRFRWARQGSAHSEAPRTGPLWAQRLAQVQLAVIYLASGGSKLLDPDWRGGDVIGDRLRRSIEFSVSKGVPRGVMEALSDPLLASALSQLAISTELFLAFALFAPRLRFFALWLGVMFHLTIEITSNVELFGYLCLTLYALFASPALRERAFVYDPTSPKAVRLARALRAFDWLARFDIRSEGTSRSWQVVDKDGEVKKGLPAIALIARAIPILLPLSVPLVVLARLAHRKRDARVPAC